MDQSIQELEIIIMNDLKELYSLGINNTNKINLPGFNGDFQGYIFYKQTKEPKKYERLFFNRNCSEPVCEDLGELIGGFMLTGCLDYERNIQINRVEELLNEEPAIERMKNILVLNHNNP